MAGSSGLADISSYIDAVIGSLERWNVTAVVVVASFLGAIPIENGCAEEWECRRDNTERDSIPGGIGNNPSCSGPDMMETRVSSFTDAPVWTEL